MFVIVLSVVYNDGVVFLFVFKQKTAYEMRISDWSSDVCSSDLELGLRDGWRWSPDSRRIAYWQLVADSVRDFALINYTDSLYPTVTPIQYRSEERRVGKECVSTCRSRWSPYH